MFENELTFRLLLLALFVGFIGHRGYYTRKIQVRQEDTIDRPRNQEPLGKAANLIALPGLLGVLVYLVYPAGMQWAGLGLPVWLRLAGLGLAALGFGVLQWSHLALGKNWSDQPRIQREHQLITSGPYRRVRHPIYTAFLMILGSTLLISSNGFIGLTWIAMTSLDVSWRIRSEEQMLVKQFGDRFTSYAAGTGRLLPRLFG
ncbi:MAG: methyltransferase family protein [Anaerolineales bacterium]